MASYTNLKSLKGLVYGDTVTYTSNCDIDFYGAKVKIEIYGNGPNTHSISSKCTRLNSTSKGGYATALLDASSLRSTFYFRQSGGTCLSYRLTDSRARILVAGEAGSTGYADIDTVLLYSDDFGNSKLLEVMEASGGDYTTTGGDGGGWTGGSGSTLTYSSGNMTYAKGGTRYSGGEGANSASGSSVIGSYAGEDGTFGVGGSGKSIDLELYGTSVEIGSGEGGDGWYGGGSGSLTITHSGSSGYGQFHEGAFYALSGAGGSGMYVDSSYSSSVLTSSEVSKLKTAMTEGSLTKGGGQSTGYKGKMVITIKRAGTEPVPQIKYYNGSSFKDVYVNYYNGLSFKKCKVHYYDGSSWKDIGGS